MELSDEMQMGDLFGKNVRTVSEHIRNVFKEGELDEPSVIRNFRITAADGKLYDTQFYNLDVIISVGYRVKSKRGTQFRSSPCEQRVSYQSGAVRPVIMQSRLITE